jgi:hypothetical protein
MGREHQFGDGQRAHLACGCQVQRIDRRSLGFPIEGYEFS